MIRTASPRPGPCQLVDDPFCVSTAARGDAVLMFDLRGAVREAIWDAIASMVTVGLLITVLVVSVLSLGAYALSTHRLIAAAMRAAVLTVLTWLTIGVLTDERMTALDTATTYWFLAHRSGGFYAVASVITDLAGPVATAVAGVICGVLLSWRARSVIPGVARDRYGRRCNAHQHRTQSGRGAAPAPAGVAVDDRDRSFVSVRARPVWRALVAAQAAHHLHTFRPE
jgi:hypothetical protein